MKLRLTISFTAFSFALLLLPSAFAETVFTNAAAFSSAVSNPTVTTFGTTAYTNGFTNVAAAGATYTTGSVSFTSPNAPLNIDNANYYTTNGGSPVYPDGNYLLFASVASPANALINIVFPSSTAFGISLGGDFAPGETFTYTLSDGFTGSYTATSYVTSGLPLDFLGFTSTSPITSITISAAETGNPASFDNVTYATAVTPEPSSLYLLGTGLLGGIVAVRRRFGLGH